MKSQKKKKNEPVSDPEFLTPAEEEEIAQQLEQSALVQDLYSNMPSLEIDLPLE